MKALLTSILILSCCSTAPARAADLPATSAPGDSITLAEAVRLALESHPSIELAAEGVKAAQAQIGVARSADYPSVSGEAGYVRLDPVSFFDLPGSGQTDLFPPNGYDLHLSAGKKLYDFGRTATTVRLAESGLTTAQDNVEMARWNLAYFTVSTFNLILILRENITLLDEQISTLDEHQRVSQTKLDTGSGTKLDVLTTQVRVAAAKNARIDAATALEKQEIVLNVLVGSPPDQPRRPRGAFVVQPGDFNVDSLRSAALSARPELRVAQDAESSAAVQVHFATLGDKPSLGFGLTSGVKNGYFPDLDRWRLNLAAALNLEVPLFDGHRSQRQEEFAQANLRAARAHSADLRWRITAEVEQAAAGAQAGLEKIQNTQVQVERAREALAIAKTQYGAGTATNLDLLDAEASLSEALLLNLRAKYDCVNDKNTLDRVTGKKIW